MSVSTITAAPDVLKMLAHDLRWRLMHILALGDHRVQELAGMVGEQQNLVSYHLRKLRDAQLVRERRSTADGRDVYYSLDMGKLRDLYFAEGESLHPSLGGTNTSWEKVSIDVEERREDDEGRDANQSHPPARVLFLCTRNSARSQMAEGIMRHYGRDMVEVNSAGSETWQVHPDAISAMSRLAIDISKQHSKHLSEFVDQDFDYVITVCDRARESCPIFPGDPVQIHWSFADPAAVEGETERAHAFYTTAVELTTRIRYLLALIERDRK